MRWGKCTWERTLPQRLPLFKRKLSVHTSTGSSRRQVKHTHTKCCYWLKLSIRGSLQICVLTGNVLEEANIYACSSTIFFSLLICPPLSSSQHKVARAVGLQATCVFVEHPTGHGLP